MSYPVRLLVRAGFVKQLIIFPWLLIAALAVSGYGYVFRFWLADVIYYQDNSNQENIVKAINLNPYQIKYYTALSKLNLNFAKASIMESGQAADANNLENYFSNALFFAQKASELNSDSVNAWENLGMIWRDFSADNSGREKAIEYFKKALEYEPTNPVLYIQIGKLALLNNDFEASISAFKRAKELKTDYEEANFYLAKAYAQAGNYDQAIALFGELQETSSDPEIFYEKGRIFYNQGKVDEAILEFDKALTIAPNHSNSLYSLGVAYMSQGERSKALNYFEKVLELNPGNQDILDKIAELKY